MHPYKTHHLNFSRHKGTKTKHTHLHTTTKFITCTHNPLTKPHPLLYHHFPPFPLPSSAPALPAMANASLQSFLLHHHHSFLNSSIHDSSHSIILKLTTSTSVSFKLFSNNSSVTTASTPNSSAPTPATPDATTSPPPASLDLLGRQLAGGDYRQADETTRALLIDLAGESARRRGYVFFSEVQFISTADLRAIDTLWREHSNGKFGYSVQRRLWEKSRRDFTRFFIKVGWMKKLDTEVEQFNYRAFPDEFIWELNDDTPEGHLPLTNALRGTQLLGNILTHPAFEDSRQEATEEENNTAATTDQSKDDNKGRERPQLRDFKPDYSF